MSGFLLRFFLRLERRKTNRLLDLLPLARLTVTRPSGSICLAGHRVSGGVAGGGGEPAGNVSEHSEAASASVRGEAKVQAVNCQLSLPEVRWSCLLSVKPAQHTEIIVSAPERPRTEFSQTLAAIFDRLLLFRL